MRYEVMHLPNENPPIPPFSKGGKGGFVVWGGRP